MISTRGCWPPSTFACSSGRRWPRRSSSARCSRRPGARQEPRPPARRPASATRTSRSTATAASTCCGTGSTTPTASATAPARRDPDHAARHPGPDDRSTSTSCCRSTGSRVDGRRAGLRPGDPAPRAGDHAEDAAEGGGAGRTSWSGTPACPARYGYRGESNWLANDHEVVTMNQPHMAPWWFPANDHPLDKALVDITITVPRGKQVVANGRLVSRQRPRRRGDVPLAGRRADGAVPRVLRGRPLRDLAAARSDGLPWLVAVSEQLAPSVRRDRDGADGEDARRSSRGWRPGSATTRSARPAA